MTPADRQKLTDAFTKAVNASPYANEVVDGIVTHEGKPITRRALVEGTLKMEEFYDSVDKALATGKITLDEIIVKFEQGMKKSIYQP